MLGEDDRTTGAELRSRSIPEGVLPVTREVVGPQGTARTQIERRHPIARLALLGIGDEPDPVLCGPARRAHLLRIGKGMRPATSAVPALP